MIFRANVEVWNTIADEVQARLKRWHTPGKLDRAFRFMIATGQPEFTDLVWPQLTHENDQVHLGAFRAAERFRPSVLGKNAAERLAGLPRSVRRNVLSEIASNSGIEGLDLATAVAKADADLDVKVGVAGSLSFRRADRHLADLLRDSDDTVYDRLAREPYIDDIDDDEVMGRLTAARKRQKASVLSPRDRLYALQRAKPSEEVSRDITELVTNLDINTLENDNFQLIWKLKARHPEAIAKAVLSRLRAGKELFYAADDILAAAGFAFEDDDLLKIALSETNPHYDMADAAASILGPNAVGVMVDTYCEARSRLRDRDGSFDQAASDRYSALRQRLSHTQGTSLVGAIFARSDAAKDEELACLADLLSRQVGTGDGRERPFDAKALETIGKLAQDWADRLLAAHGVSRYHKAAIARMIGHAPAAALLPTLQRLLDDNLKRYHDFREAAKATQRQDRAAVQEAQNPHTHEYQSTLIAIHAPETFDVVTGYLTNEHFGENAARVLAIQWAEENEPKEEQRFMGGIDFSRVIARRAARHAKPNESCLEADTIFSAVETLISDRTTDEQHKRAVILGSIGARVPHGNRAAVFEKLIAFAPRQLRAALLLALVLSGEDVSTDLIMDGIDETFEDAKANP